MAVMMKIYRSKMITEVVSASSFREVKSSIDATVSKLKEQNVSEQEILKLIDEMLNELKALSQCKLSYHQDANIISANVHLEELRLLLFQAIN
jgi:hypothetical protein